VNQRHLKHVFVGLTLLCSGAVFAQSDVVDVPRPEAWANQTAMMLVPRTDIVIKLVSSPLAQSRVQLDYAFPWVLRQSGELLQYKDGITVRNLDTGAFCSLVADYRPVPFQRVKPTQLVMTTEASLIVDPQQPGQMRWRRYAEKATAKSEVINPPWVEIPFEVEQKGVRLVCYGSQYPRPGYKSHLTPLEFRKIMNVLFKIEKI